MNGSERNESSNRERRNQDLWNTNTGFVSHAGQRIAGGSSEERKSASIAGRRSIRTDGGKDGKERIENAPHPNRLGAAAEHNEARVRLDLNNIGFGRVVVRAVSQFTVFVHTRRMTEGGKERLREHFEDKDHAEHLGSDHDGEIWRLNI